jgi:hypothetical protein
MHYNGLGYDFGVKNPDGFSSLEISRFKVSTSFSLFIQHAEL